MWSSGGSHDAANVIAIYATLMAGATYVPVSKHSPWGRVHSMINQAAATTVLGDDDEDIAGILTSPVNWYLNYRQWLEAGHGQGACIMPAYPAVDSSLAYIMFTSGTTGVPKGVSVTHRAALNTLQDCRKRFAIDDSDRLLGISEFSFDLSVFDLFMPALSGCALVLGHSAESAEPNAWLVAAREHRVSIWNSVPAIMEMALSYALSRLFFSHEEQAVLAKLAGPAREEAFYRLWTLKEAGAKACGQGIGRAWSRLGFACQPPAQEA
ncbi:AMP-binding protein [Pseudomonas sp. R3-41]